MSVAELREKLHEYIDHADERHLNAIYTLLGDSAPHTDDISNMVLDNDDMERLYQRRENHRNGISKSYTVEESMEMIRQYKKNK